jgi:hypothetical protein
MDGSNFEVQLMGMTDDRRNAAWSGVHILNLPSPEFRVRHLDAPRWCANGRGQLVAWLIARGGRLLCGPITDVRAGESERPTWVEAV